MTNGRHCDTCDRTFVNDHAARQHRNARGHWECEVCWVTFDDGDDAEEHMESDNHRSDRYCSDCHRGFISVHNYQQVRLLLIDLLKPVH